MKDLHNLCGLIFSITLSYLDHEVEECWVDLWSKLILDIFKESLRSKSDGLMSNVIIDL
jgi:hypothetical protein